MWIILARQDSNYCQIFTSLVILARTNCHVLGRDHYPACPKSTQLRERYKTLVRLTELVLTLNPSSFNGKFYSQTGGVAKGSRLGPNYKCLFIGHIEDQIFKFDLYSRRTPDLCKWYIDDIAGAFSGFATVTNDFQPSLNVYLVYISDE